MQRVRVDDHSRREKEEVEQAARGSFTGRQVARGNLGATPFPEVLAQLYRWRSTGALLLRKDRIKKIVYLRQGYPILVKSNLLSECLGRVMVRERMITEADCETSLVRMKDSGRQQGTALIEMGCISPHNLAYALQLQLETKLYEVFSWTGGEYQFNPTVEPPATPVQLEHTPAALILEGIKRTWSSQRIQTRLHPLLDALVGPHPEPLHVLGDLQLTDREQAFVAALDGRVTVRTALLDSPLTSLQSAWLVYGLLAAQVLSTTQAVDAGAAAGAVPPLPSAPSSATASKPAATRPPPLPERVSTTATDTLVLGSSRSATRATLVPADRERAEAMGRRIKEMRRMNHFELLGISKNAAMEEVRKAYFAQAKDYHPDRHFGSSSSEVKVLADQIYSMLSAAYEVLSDGREREEYLRGLRPRHKSGLPDEVSRILQAEARFQRGEALARRQEWARAATAFEQAVALYAEEGEFHAHLGWALWQAHGQDAQAAPEAERHLEQGIRLSPRSDKAYVFLGTLYKQTGRKAAAEQQFEKAIQCNPDCVDALRELRLLQKGGTARTGA